MRFCRLCTSFVLSVICRIINMCSTPIEECFTEHISKQKPCRHGGSTYDWARSMSCMSLPARPTAVIDILRLCCCIKEGRAFVKGHYLPLDTSIKRRPCVSLESVKHFGLSSHLGRTDNALKESCQRSLFTIYGLHTRVIKIWSGLKLSFFTMWHRDSKFQMLGVTVKM